MGILQVSVFVENKAGRLADITELLAEKAINIRALSVADTTHFGILRLIVDDPKKAEKVLTDGSFTVSLTRVIGVAVSDSPGGLAKALRVLCEAGISVEYMYAFITRVSGKACVILRVEDEGKAVAALAEKGISVLTEGGFDE